MGLQPCWVGVAAGWSEVASGLSGLEGLRGNGSARNPARAPGSRVRFVEEGLPHARLGIPHVRSPSRLGAPVPYFPGPRAALATGSPAGALLARPPPVCPAPRSGWGLGLEAEAQDNGGSRWTQHSVSSHRGQLRPLRTACCWF